MIFNNLFKEKEIKIYSPCDGIVVSQKNIPDEGFSEGHMGLGVGIEPTSSEIYAPLSGKLLVLFRTKHAYIIQDQKAMISVMLHLGINTVEIPLEKNAFITTLKQDDQVKENLTLLCNMDLNVVKSEGKSLVSALLIQHENLENKKIIYHKSNGPVKKGDLLLSIVPK